MKEEQQEHQQQMIEILEKVSDQMKRVENMHSGSVPPLEGEYYTPPASQMRVNTSSKLSAPLNLPIILGQGTSTWYGRVSLPMALPGGGCFRNSHQGSSQVSCDRVS